MYKLLNPNYQNDAISMMKRWLENKNNGKTFAEFFHKYGCKSVIIIDAGEIGRILYKEIKDSDIKVVCFFDRNAEGMRLVENTPVYSFGSINNIPKVDMIIVSPVYSYDDVNRMLIRVNSSIRSMSMKDAVYEF